MGYRGGALLRCACIAVVALCVLNASAHAQEGDAEEEGPPPEAMRFFESGRQHYNAGQYTQAAEDLERALELDPNSPTLIFNLSRIYELMGPSHIESAIAYGERYLTMLPPDAEAERAQIQTTLLRLNGAKAYFDRQREAEAGGMPELMGIEETVYVQSRGVADGWFWSFVALGGAMLAGSVLTGIVSLNRRRAYEERVLSPGQNEVFWTEYKNSIAPLARLTDALWIGSIVMGLVATAVYFRRTERYELGDAEDLEEGRDDRDEERDEEPIEDQEPDDPTQPRQWFDVGLGPVQGGAMVQLRGHL